MTDTSAGSQKIRVGIIGAGWWAQNGHLPVLGFLDQFVVVAVSSRRLAQAEELAVTFGIAHAFADPHQLIDHPVAPGGCRVFAGRRSHSWPE